MKKKLYASIKKRKVQIPDFKSGIESLFSFPDNTFYDNYMRGNVANDLRENWEIIGDDIRVAIRKYQKKNALWK